MSALMKKHLTNQVVRFAWKGGHYAIPLEILEHYKVQASDTDYISAADLFHDLLQESGEPGVLLKGLRYRDGLSQLELAKKLQISQTNLSAIENGKRLIGKELAKRLADLFGVNYRIFL